jgi:hypothetical protein
MALSTQLIKYIWPIVFLSPSVQLRPIRGQLHFQPVLLMVFSTHIKNNPRIPFSPLKGQLNFI